MFYYITDVYLTKLLFTDEDENGNELPISGVCLLGAILVLYIDNIIKWPMPLGARPRSIKNVNKIL